MKIKIALMFLNCLHLEMRLECFSFFFIFIPIRYILRFIYLYQFLEVFYRLRK